MAPFTLTPRVFRGPDAQKYFDFFSQFDYFKPSIVFFNQELVDKVTPKEFDIYEDYYVDGEDYDYPFEGLQCPEETIDKWLSRGVEIKNLHHWVVEEDIERRCEKYIQHLSLKSMNHNPHRRIHKKYIFQLFQKAERDDALLTLVNLTDIIFDIDNRFSVHNEYISYFNKIIPLRNDITVDDIFQKLMEKEMKKSRKDNLHTIENKIFILEAVGLDLRKYPEQVNFLRENLSAMQKELEGVTHDYRIRGIEKCNKLLNEWTS